MNLEFHLRVAGSLQIALAGLHLFFPERFNWREELARLSLLNRQIFIVHVLFICVILSLFGALSLFAPQALLQPTPLARLVLAGLVGFWALRLGVQWFVYDASLWKGRAARTAIHWAFTALWVYLVAVYAGALAAHLSEAPAG